MYSYIRRSGVLALSLIFSVLLSSCSKPEEQVLTLRMAHTLDQEHVVHKAMVKLAERLDHYSHGTMKIRIYSGGQLGSERELIELLQIGALALTKVSAAPLEGFAPNMQLFSVPYVFRDETQLWQVLEGEIGQQLLAELAPVRLKGLGYYDAGSRSFYTTNNKSLYAGRFGRAKVPRAEQPDCCANGANAGRRCDTGRLG